MIVGHKHLEIYYRLIQYINMQWFRSAGFSFFKTTPQFTTSLLDTLELIIMSQELHEKYYKPKNAATLEIIKYLIKTSPDFLTQIQKAFIEHIHHNQIEIENVNSIITIFTQLYKHILLFHDDKLLCENHVENCCNVMKFIFLVSVQENIINADCDRSKLLSSFDKIIHSFKYFINDPMSKPTRVMGITDHHVKYKHEIAVKTGCFYL